MNQLIFVSNIVLSMLIIILYVSFPRAPSLEEASNCRDDKMAQLSKLFLMNLITTVLADLIVRVIF